MFLFILTTFATLVFWLLYPDLLGSDWLVSFQPATETLLANGDPYAVDQFMLAPWTFILFIPLSFLPSSLAVAILRVLGLLVYSYVAIRLKVKPWGLVFLLLSPQVLHNLINGNVDWLAFLGFILPPQLGLFFLFIKPQIGAAYMVFLLFDSIKQKKFLQTFSPFLIGLALSFIIFGLWPLRFSTVQAAYNASLWPYSLPFGIVLLYVSLRRQNARIAQAISPLFSPHVMFHSWATMLFALAPETTELILAVIASWILVAVKAMGW